MMTKREQLKRKVIEAIHDLPYEEAVSNEVAIPVRDDEYPFRIGRTGSGAIVHEFIPFPITIGRVMQALGQLYACAGGSILELESFGESTKHKFVFIAKGIKWKLTKENGQECTDDDQTDETIEAILKLLS